MRLKRPKYLYTYLFTAAFVAVNSCHKDPIRVALANPMQWGLPGQVKFPI
jgi:hypothetical protein